MSNKTSENQMEYTTTKNIELPQEYSSIVKKIERKNYERIAKKIKSQSRNRLTGALLAGFVGSICKLLF